MRVNDKTPPVAFCPIRGYSFGYGQDSGVRGKSDLYGRHLSFKLNGYLVYDLRTTHPLTAWFGQMLLGRQAASVRLCHYGNH